MSTLVCVPIMAEDAASALADAADARRQGADLVEFRIDRLFSGEGDDAGERAALALCRDSPLPCIITCRPSWEGGDYDGDEPARISLFEKLGTSNHPPAYIDVELAAYTRSANVRQKINLAVEHPKQQRDLHTRLILSIHDFTARPRDLTRRLAAARAEPAASVIKVAYRCRSLRDNLELFDILRERDRPTIALGMGEFGLMSRVLAPKFGAFLTFASLRDSAATAPGQPTIHELLNLYRFRKINPATSVYGVIGWPVSHSLSPLIHNAGFDSVGHDGVYLPLPVVAHDADPDLTCTSFQSTLEELASHPDLLLRGLSVTMPFKTCLARYAQHQCSEIHPPMVRASGAANTARLLDHHSQQHGTSRLPIQVANTDASAVRQLLTQQLNGLGGRTIAVFGAGGVARAAAFACAHEGAHVFVCARNPAKASSLASHLTAHVDSTRNGSVHALSLHETLSRPFDALINCTPVGMKNGPDPHGCSIPLADMPNLPTNAIVFDTVYNPIETPLIRQARARGFRVIDGAQMFVTQAAAQFDIWMNDARERPAPVQLFDRLIRTASR